jgi:hypothetical protein
MKETRYPSERYMKIMEKDTKYTARIKEGEKRKDE